MGQRHQLFVIAKVNRRYRTLCAIHHQWLYGHTALRRCLGTLKIFSDPANRIPLQQELIAAQRRNEAFWTEKNDWKNIHVPFPFTATCLITGASFDPDEGYYHRVLVEPFGLAYDEGDNKNGITIFDITELCNVRYCFVDFHGMESERPVQLMTPLTARIYLEAYYDLSDRAKDLHALLDELNAWEVIPVAVLQDTWPQGAWKEPESFQEGVDELGVQKRERTEISKPGSLKSLRDGAMANVIQALLDGSDDTDNLLSEAELLIDFLPTLKEKIYEQPGSLKPSPSLLDLLPRALEEETDADLSPFKNFSAQDLTYVVSHLQQHGKMQTLCISNRPDLTAEDLQMVVRVAPGLKALYILEDPQISMQDAIPHSKDCDLFSSDLLRQAIEPDPTGQASNPESLEQPYKGNHISQLVWIGITDQQALDNDLRLKSGLIDWATLEEKKGQRDWAWSGRGLKYKRYPLDIPLSTFRTVAGLLRLFKWGFKTRLYDVESFSSGAAFSFAMASSIPGGTNLRTSPTSHREEIGASATSDDNESGSGPKSVDGSGSNSTSKGNGFGIGPLTPALYRGSSRECDSGGQNHLEHHRWAIILIHEAWDALNQKSLDKRQQAPSGLTDSGDSEDENPLGLPIGEEGSEQSVAGMMARLLGPRDPFENRGKNQNLPFRAIKRLRYALVAPRTETDPSGHDYIVADIPTYLEHVVGKGSAEYESMVEAWTSRVAAMEGVGFYGDEDIWDILPKVFPGQKDKCGSEKQE